jgi:adenylosuccinate synthase
VVDVQADLAKMRHFAAKLKPMVVDTIPWMHSVLGTKKVLVEGANAAMLDIDFGTYPQVHPPPSGTCAHMSALHHCSPLDAR